jgi:hypothetical protein
MAPLTPEHKEVLKFFREQMQTRERDGWDHLDEMIFKIAAGGLALSVTFIGVVKTPAPTSMAWVYLAWGTLTFGLLALLFSKITANMSLRNRIARFDDGTFYDVPKPGPGWYYDLATNVFNYVTVSATAIGLLFLVVFALGNLSGAHMTDRHKNLETAVPSQSLGEQRGAPAMTAPPQPTTVSPIILPNGGAPGFQVPAQPATPAPAPTPTPGGDK